MSRFRKESKKKFFLLFLLIVFGCSNVTIDEIRTKLTGGPEFRDNGQTSHERWASQVGIGITLSNGHKVGMAYRRRDDSHNDGWSKNDNGVFFEYSFPIWTRKKIDKTIALKKEMDDLKQEIAELKK